MPRCIGSSETGPLNGTAWSGSLPQAGETAAPSTAGALITQARTASLLALCAARLRSREIRTRRLSFRECDRWFFLIKDLYMDLGTWKI